MSANREDYLKAIFHANEHHVKLTNKELAKQLDISAASSSEMISKLVDAGKVVRDQHLGIALTDLGEMEAAKLIRKHRLWEVFLVDHLGYSWAEVHQEAEVLEHVTSDKLSDQLDKFLNYPKHCPHGSIVFGNTKQELLSPFNTLVVGDKASVAQVIDDPDLLGYLEEIELEIDDKFIVKKIDIENNTISIESKNRIIHLNRQMSDRISVYKD